MMTEHGLVDTMITSGEYIDSISFEKMIKRYYFDYLTTDTSHNTVPLNRLDSYTFRLSHIYIIYSYQMKGKDKIIWESQTVTTWLDIFKKRVATWKAEYETYSVNAIHAKRPATFDLCCSWNTELPDTRLNDILFWSSNFFEVMFGIDGLYHISKFGWDVWFICDEVETRWIVISMKASDYHKSQCAISKDRLKYLLESLPSD